MAQPSSISRFVVGSENAGKRLDVVLGELPEIGSRSQAAAALAEGRVTVDGVIRPKSYRLQEGEVLSVQERQSPSMELNPEDIPIAVFYEDEYLIVVDKPAGMVVHPAPGHKAGTLVHALLGRGIAGGEEFRPGVVHRLDRDTSGLLVVAKNNEVHRELSKMIRGRAVGRRYLALVHGYLPTSSGTIEAPIGRDPERRKTMTVGGAGRREAVTHFRVLERFGDFTVVEARLETGRTHQIRVHFAAIGHPVTGDPAYARRDPLGVGRQFLHSWRLTFRHPVTGLDLDLKSTLPADLNAVLERLRHAATTSP